MTRKKTDSTEVIEDDRPFVSDTMHPDLKRNLQHNRENLFDDEFIGEDGRIHKKEREAKNEKLSDCSHCGARDMVVEIPGMDGAKQCKSCGNWTDMEEFVKGHN